MEVKNVMSSIDKVVARVMLSLKGGEELHVRKNTETIFSIWNKQIQLGENKLKSLKNTYDEQVADQTERVEELKKSLKETFTNISAEKLTVDERKDYVINAYQPAIERASRSLKLAEAKLKDLKDTYTTEVEKTEKGISLYKGYIALLEE